MERKGKMGKDNIILFKSEDEKIAVDVRFDEDTVWLSQQQIADLFHTSRNNVTEHIGNIYADVELTEEATCREFRQVQMEGNTIIIMRKRKFDNYRRKSS